MKTLQWVLCCAFLMVYNCAMASTIYVDCDAVGSDDGTSWADAYNDLQDALSVAVNNDEIWVAEGTYYPGTITSSRFELVAGVDMFGGFDGTEKYEWQRDSRNNPTILSGDIDLDGINDADDCECVVYADNINDLFSGFVVTNGYTTSNYGACLRIVDNYGVMQISECVFENGTALSGGGVYINDDAGALFKHCIFRYNAATSFGALDTEVYGGGLWNMGGAGTGCYLDNCLFHDNSCTGTYAYGGGAAYGDWTYTGSMGAHHCTFTQNSSVQIDGYYPLGIAGGAYNFYMYNSIMFGNSMDDTSLCSDGSYSCIEHLDVDTPAKAFNQKMRGNIWSSPQFTDPLYDDFTLNLSTSPCVDAGKNQPNSAFAQGTLDLNGNNRYVQSTVGHGPVDFNGDNVIDHVYEDHINSFCPFVTDMGCYETQYSLVLDADAPKHWIRLVAASDTGVSDSDTITNLDNTTGKALTFEILNLLSGEDCYFRDSDGLIAASFTGNGGTAWQTVTTDQIHSMSDGWQEVVVVCPSDNLIYYEERFRICIDTVAPEFEGISINNGSVVRSNIAFIDFEMSEDVVVDTSSSDVLTIMEYSAVAPYWVDITLTNSPDVFVDGNVIKWDIWSPGYQTILANNWYAAAMDISCVSDLAGNTVVQPSQTEKGSCKFYRMIGDCEGYSDGGSDASPDVDVDDFNVLQAVYGWTGNWYEFNLGDFNLDGNANIDDFISLKQNYNTALIAEPAYYIPNW